MSVDKPSDAKPSAAMDLRSPQRQGTWMICACAG
jgi:hypothetical protein